MSYYFEIEYLIPNVLRNFIFHHTNGVQQIPLSSYLASFVHHKLELKYSCGCLYIIAHF